MDFEKELNELKAKFTPSNAIKFLAGTLISFGATAAIIAAMKNPLMGAKGITKLLMKLGVFVLACKAGDVAEKYYRDVVNDAEDAFKKAQSDATKEIRMKGEEKDAGKSVR